MATLDQLSGGRAILTVGLGAVDPGLGEVGEEMDRRLRAERLDEGLDVVTGLWAGRRSFSGRHFAVDVSQATVADLDAVLTPVQRIAGVPRVPVWVVGAWPRERSMARVLRCDGVVPYCFGEDGPRDTVPDDVAPILRWLGERADGVRDFDVVVEGTTPEDAAAAAAHVRPWERAGATWWLEALWQVPEGEDHLAAVHRRVEAGPPRLAAAHSE